MRRENAMHPVHSKFHGEGGIRSQGNNSPSHGAAPPRDDAADASATRARMGSDEVREIAGKAA